MSLLELFCAVDDFCTVMASAPEVPLWTPRHWPCVAIAHPPAKVFGGIAARGKTSMGWLYGFKLHLVANDCGELLACQLTPGNIDDRQPVPTLAKRLFGKLFGDKGYINQQLVAQLLNACTFPPPQSAQLCRQSVGTAGLPTACNPRNRYCTCIVRFCCRLLNQNSRYQLQPEQRQHRQQRPYR